MTHAAATRHAPNMRLTRTCRPAARAARFRPEVAGEEAEAIGPAERLARLLAQESRDRAPLRREQGELEVDPQQAEHDEGIEHRRRVRLEPRPARPRGRTAAATPPAGADRQRRRTGGQSAIVHRRPAVRVPRPPACALLAAHEEHDACRLRERQNVVTESSRAPGVERGCVSRQRRRLADRLSRTAYQ